MSNKATIQLVVETDNTLFKILSIIERSSNDLLIYPKHALYYRDFNDENDSGSSKIKHQHYSVHCSPDSPDGINAIKHTLELETQESEITRHYTLALKKYNLFAPLYACRCPNLQQERLKTTPTKGSVISLGKYFPLESVMYYMLVVGNPGQDFNEITLPDLNIKTIQFKNFSLTIIWSFGFFPSDHTGAKQHFLTIPDKESYNQTMDGFTKDEIILQFKINRQGLQEEFVNLLVNLLKGSLSKHIDEISLINRMGFRKNSSVIPEMNINIVDYQMIDRQDLLGLLLELQVGYYKTGAHEMILHIETEKDSKDIYSRYINELERQLNDTALILMIKKEAGEAIGFIIGRIEIDTDLVKEKIGIVEDWFIQPSYRKHGIGTALYNELENWFREKDCYQVQSGTWDWNELSIKAHKKLGFITSEVKFVKKL